jgi:hypothetical protein
MTQNCTTHLRWRVAPYPACQSLHLPFFCACVASCPRHYGMQHTPLGDPDMEGESWIPGDAARLTTGFRRTHLRHVPLALIRDFLLDLNGVWRRRMNSVVAGLKDKWVPTPFPSTPPVLFLACLCASPTVGCGCAHAFCVSLSMCT